MRTVHAACAYYGVQPAGPSWGGPSPAEVCCTVLQTTTCRAMFVQQSSLPYTQARKHASGSPFKFAFVLLFGQRLNGHHQGSKEHHPRLIEPAAARHLQLSPDALEIAALSDVGSKPQNRGCAHSARHPSDTAYRHTDKDESFCLTLDKFFTRPLSTQAGQAYQWGQDLPIVAGLPSHQAVFDRSRGNPSISQAKIPTSKPEPKCSAKPLSSHLCLLPPQVP